jgi:hypothetical protein
MAIEKQYFALVVQVAKRLDHLEKPLKALFLSYPDLLMAREDLCAFLSDAIVDSIPVRDDSATIWAWHGMPGRSDPVYDSLETFKQLGIESHVIDVIRATGSEEIVDLNQPLPDRLKGVFDLVVDTGTCEHCFNVGQAFANACSAVKVGGYLIHAAPMTRVNHGFWNFCPTVYPDFFDDNGFKIHLLTGMSVDMKRGFQPIPLSVGRFVAPSEAIIFVVAEKVINTPLKWPLQRKYRSS